MFVHKKNLIKCTILLWLQELYKKVFIHIFIIYFNYISIVLTFITKGKEKEFLYKNTLVTIRYRSGSKFGIRIQIFAPKSDKSIGIYNSDKKHWINYLDLLVSTSSLPVQFRIIRLHILFHSSFKANNSICIFIIYAEIFFVLFYESFKCLNYKILDIYTRTNCP